MNQKGSEPYQKYSEGGRRLFVQAFCCWLIFRHKSNSLPELRKAGAEKA
jgi:hypothetical protein